jgi:protein ImuB
VRLALERDPPGAPVAAVTVATEGRPARRDQLDLFRPAGPAPAALDALVAELELLCGEGRVGTPRIPDDPHPDAIATAPFAPPQQTTTARSTRTAHSEATRSAGEPASEGTGGAGARSEPKASEVDKAGRAGNPPPTLALRAFRPPLPAQVYLRSGRPDSVRSALANGDVVRCAGPWRATGGWWSETHRFAFDSYDVATSDGLLVRLRHDLLCDRWHIDAAYD